MNLKRTFLMAVLISLASAAALGVFAFVFGNFGEVEWRIILTTLTVALFSLTALLASLVMERGTWRPAMLAALVLSGTGLLTYMPMIWLDIRWYRHEWLIKVMWLQALWGVALPHSGMLALTRFTGRLKWVRFLSIQAVFLLAGTITAATIFEIDDEVIFRAIGVLGILAALGTIGLPILFKVHGLDKLAAVESTPLDISITCPRCLLDQVVASGHSRCTRCRLKFSIEIEEPRCPKCQYLLHQLTEPQCPECGDALAPDEVAPATPA